MKKIKYTCPCCGYMTLDEPLGGFDICPICYWEADLVQSTEPDEYIGPNHISLRQAQKNFVMFGACTKDHIKHTKKPTKKDKRDPGWKILN